MRTDSPRIDSLSNREHQILVMASHGSTDDEIAKTLSIGRATVVTYWNRIRAKIGSLGRTEIVAVFLKDQCAKAIEEIHLEHAELLKTLELKTREVDYLRTNLNLLQSVIDGAPDGILLIDEDGSILLVNAEAQAQFGYCSEEFLRMDVDELLPEHQRDEHRENRKTYYENPAKRRMGEHLATHARRKDGTEFPMAAALSPCETSTGLYVTCIVRDLSEALRKMYGNCRW